MNFAHDVLLRDDVWETGGPRLSFSYSGEDRFLAILFESIEAGFYVDFGCFHPFIYSNTFLLHNRGWSGLNLDANPDAIASMIRARPNDTNVHMAVAEHAGKTELVFFGEFASSNTTSKEFADEIIAKQGVEVKRMIQVRCDTTKGIFDKFISSGTPIHYWNIDIEGFDLIALKTNDWETYVPWVVSVEDFEFVLGSPQKSEIHQLLTSLNYMAVSRYLFTTIYLSETAAPRLKELAVPIATRPRSSVA